MATSQPIGSGRIKESAVISRARLRKQRGAVERWTALVVLFVSFVGTIVALNGGWPSIIALKIGPAAVLGGLAIQGLLTYFEWHYYDRRAISWGARLVDTAFTAVGYGPLLVPPLTVYLAGKSVPSAIYAAWGIAVLVSFLTAWYPESRLVD